MIFSVLLLILFPGVTVADHFGYSLELQKEWTKQSASCEGKNQSPISISTASAIPLAIPALEFVGYHNLLPRPISISNNGHSVELKPYRVPAQDNTAQIFGGLLPNKYHLESFHFHWGRKNNRGSEHVIDSVRFPMEMHIIHRNEKYDTINEALNHSDGLVVLAFFLQTREKDNSALRPILEELQFLMSQFRTLTSGTHHLQDNYRRLQPLNERKIYAKRVVADASYFKNSFLNVSDPAFWH